MVLEGIFGIVDGLLFVAVYIIMQLYTNLLYQLQNEWKPQLLYHTQERYEFAYRTTIKSARHEPPPLPQTRSERRRQLDARRQSTIIHKPPNP